MANPKPPKTTIGILFQVHIDDVAPKTVRAGYAELRARLAAYAKALEKDDNIIVSDSYVNVNCGELLAAQVKSANTTAERLDPVVAAAPTAPTAPVVKPAAKPVKPVKLASKRISVEPAEPDDPPHIIVHDMAEIKAEQAAKAQETNVVVLPADANDLLPKALAQLERKSEKTTALLTILIKHGKPISTSDLADTAKMKKQDVSNWLSGTTKKYKFVKSAGRGLYEFDRTALEG